MRKIIPELEKFQNKPNEEIKVSVSEGISSLKNIITNLLDSKEAIEVYGTPKEAIDVLGGFLEEFHKQRIKLKIPMRHVYDGTSLNRAIELNKMKYTAARYSPLISNSRVSTTICGNKVVLKLWEHPIKIITIENSAVAKSYHDFFQILWGSSIYPNE